MAVTVLETKPRTSRGQAAAATLLWRDKKALVSLIFLAILYTSALLAPWLVGDRNNKIDFMNSLTAPSLGPDSHLFGTDALGRDLFLRILTASQVSLFISAVVVAGSGLLGLLLGMIAGYYGGWIDEVVMRLIDLMMAFPGLLLVLVIVFIAGNGTDKVILVLVATGWTGYARVVRAETLRLREFPFVESARAIGCRDSQIILRHILPNLISVMAALAALGVVGVIMTESGLSFLGLGIQPPDVSWGLLVAEGRGYLTQAWWLAIFPGAAIFVTSMAYSLLADWISVVVDPVQRDRMINSQRRRRWRRAGTQSEGEQ
ncbi:MAG: ABC transporter permease [Anaerolineae bacterium]|nr:ABC transporter permease [Anaerolineae bacterium]